MQIAAIASIMPDMTRDPTHDLPPIRIERCESRRREPGMLLFNVRRIQASRDRCYSGWLLGVRVRSLPADLSAEQLSAEHLRCQIH